MVIPKFFSRGVVLGAMLSLPMTAAAAGPVDIPVTLSIEAVTTLTIVSVFDFVDADPGNAGTITGNNTVQFGNVQPGTYVIGKDGADDAGYHAVRISVETNEGAYDIQQKIDGDFVSDGMQTIASTKLNYVVDAGATFRTFNAGSFANLLRDDGTTLGGTNGVTNFSFDYRLIIGYSDPIDTNYTATTSFQTL